MFTWLKIEAYEKSVKCLQIVKEILIFDLWYSQNGQKWPNEMTPRNYYC